MYTRREIGKVALGALPAVALFGREAGIRAQAAPPNSRWAGVQVGLNVPYSFRGSRVMPADEVLTRCLRLGVSAVELRSQPVEAALGAPPPPPGAGRGATPEQQAARAAAVAALREWRTSAAVGGAEVVKKQYEDAGVRIDILKFDDVYTMSDGELDFAFALGKALGARALSCEIETDAARDGTKRVGQFADTHQLMIGYHGHAETTPAHWEHAFAQARFNGANLDIGHFVAGHNTSPVPFLTQHHDRITHIHVKDRKLNGGANTPFGQGDTPITEVLQTIRANQWNIQATIEFEYPVPAGSDYMTEIAKCVEFCKGALLA
jgi:sugar phosphate isomerase/epimerase